MNFYSLLACFLSSGAPQQLAAQLPRTVEVPREIVKQLASDKNVKDFIVLKKDGRAENLVALFVDLNADGRGEIIVHGINSPICGANNCVHWVYRKTAKGFQLLLDAGAIQQVIPQKTFTNGYRDLITSMHGSGLDSDRILYKFDGKQYQLRKCFYQTYRYRDKRGYFHDVKRPIVIPRKCQREI
ncbi:MAG: hypothetical protein QOF61_2851 [Acidobacteriota bacterium]|nr:hypothetical protein [Acidobacteriota bacterium]